MNETAGDLLELVRTGRASTRSELRRLTGMSRTAVVSRVNALADAGLLLLGEELASTGGRPPGSLVFNVDAGVVLSVAVGRSRTQLAGFDLAGTELATASVEHEVGAGPDAVLPPVAARLGDLLPDDRPVLGVGVSLPGAIDPERAVSLASPVMAGWDGVDLAPYVADVTDAPLLVGNDADVLALSERLGHGATYADMLVLKASTGLGLGIVAGGEVVSGHLGGAGDLGHVKVGAGAGRSCRCGAEGCLETVAGGWALVARRAGSGRDVHHVRELTALAIAGEAEARAMLRESGRLVGEVLATAITLLNPQAVVVGGDMSAAFDVYAAGLRESVYAASTVLATRDLQVLPSTYGDRAGLVGCAVMALDHVLAPRSVDARLAELAREGPSAAPSAW
ncbi:ROK family protein [Nocardioides sp. zg-1308]|uniref:ROK family protein n=1 Tax=Nocardioides sp. zg-1308 TaxID=2736253 RepID=UPI001554915D|nr:ROK family protein [Nocardioides sp. zg-1308]NPD04840.1 ROK family protein [Nocardioides sp. zg-1308]